MYTLASAVRHPATVTLAPGRAALWTGRAVTAPISIFLLMDGGLRVAGFAPYVDGLAAAGYPASLAAPIGLALLASTILYLLPRTAVLGAILVTGYLGGAIATHVRLEDGNFLFAAALGVLAWVGLYLRDPRVRAILAPRG